MPPRSYGMGRQFLDPLTGVETLPQQQPWPAALVCWHSKAEEALNAFRNGYIRVHLPRAVKIFPGAAVVLVSERGNLLGKARVKKSKSGKLQLRNVVAATSTEESVPIPQALSSELARIQNWISKQPVVGILLPPKDEKGKPGREWFAQVWDLACWNEKDSPGNSPDVREAAGYYNVSQKVAKTDNSAPAKLTKSPLKKGPLRFPGQSADERIQELLDDKVITHILVCVMFPLLALYSWVFLFLSFDITLPIALTIAAIPGFLFSGRKLLHLHRQIVHWRLGAEGEKVVGQELEELRECGYKIFHDIQDKDGNIDHVVIGPGGVFTIETKTARKPESGSCEVEYDGKHVLVNGRRPDRNPIVQAKAQAKAFCQRLQTCTGRKPYVNPIVVYPGWCIKVKVRYADVRVLNDTQIINQLQKRTGELTTEDINFFASNLKRVLQE